ncbi:MAG: hypothetical protein K0R92_3577 [Lachnospiraceae bacterium]|jgi:hypothetical protein|nr:hypothetical protein [Lachnospiraceae bacterium]
MVNIRYYRLIYSDNHDMISSVMTKFMKMVMNYAD